MEKQLVDALLGWLTIFHRPESICPRSGIKNAAATKLRLKNRKNSFKKSRSERHFRFFTVIPSFLQMCYIKPYF